MSQAAIHIAFGDMHVGCRLALMPPDGAELDAGGRYEPSPFQQKIYAIWHRAWTVWVPEITHGQRYDIVNCGDTIDGDHHGTVTQWSHNLVDQKRAGEVLLKPVIKACKATGGHYYHLRGTEAHGGMSGQHEEDLAKSLGAMPEGGQYARDELWKWIGAPKREFLGHYSHHIGVSVASQYESTAPMREIVRAFTESARWGSRVPDFLVRGHRHRHIVVPLSGAKDGKRRRRFVMVVPGWQGWPPIVYRIAGATQAPPEFGLAAVILSAQGELYTRDFTVAVERPEPE